MVEFALPRNSRVREGKTHPPPAGAKRPHAGRGQRRRHVGIEDSGSP